MDRMVIADVQKGVGGDRTCGCAVYQHIFHLIPGIRGDDECHGLTSGDDNLTVRADTAVLP